METVTIITRYAMVTGLTLLTVFGLASIIDREADRQVLGIITFWSGAALFWGGLLVAVLSGWLR